MNDENLTETEDDAEYTTCENCYESVLISDTDDDCYCPVCHAARLDEIAEDARQELHDEIDEADSDIEGILEEIREAKERLSEAKARKLAATRKLATWTK